MFYIAPQAAGKPSKRHLIALSSMCLAQLSISNLEYIYLYQTFISNLYQIYIKYISNLDLSNCKFNFTRFLS